MKNLTRIAIAGALTLVSVACMCSDDNLYTLTSPKGKRTVAVLRRNCGATTGFTTVVTERRAWFEPDIELLTVGGEALGEKQLRLHWVDDNEIVVGADSALSVYPCDLKATDLRVDY